MPFKTKEEKREYDRRRYADNITGIKKYRAAYYQENKAKMDARTKAATIARFALFKEIVAAEKDNPCMDCGIKYPPYVMDFDHRPDEGKFQNISIMIRNWKVSEASLRREIAKCDLVCANCHRERTYGRRAGSEEIEITEAA